MLHRVLLISLLLPVSLISALPRVQLTPTMRALLALSARSPLKQVLFPPKDDAQSVLLGLIEAEKQEIRAAIYSITNLALTNALIEKRKKGVRIIIITDSKQAESEYSKVKKLIRNNILVYLYPPSRVMHNKFALFARTIQNRQLCITGSFNWSDAAAHRNEENMLLLEDREIYLAYQRQFNELKSNSRLAARVA